VANVRVLGDRVALGVVELAVPFKRGTMLVLNCTEEWAPPHGADTEQIGPGMVIATAQAGKVEHAAGRIRSRSGAEEEAFADT
jgi:hypothetical protein